MDREFINTMDKNISENTAIYMIISLGGSPEPLKKSLALYNPERIFFLASHDSVALAGEVLAACTPKPQAVYEITENPNSMYECYKAARRCVDRVGKTGIPLQNVVVDYTGGTKVMTAALVLATIGGPYRFNYVGGDLRAKDGLGIVIDGHEKVYAEMNPWSVFAEEERRQIVTLFNRRRYNSAIEIIARCKENALPVEIGSYLDFVSLLAEGFMSWEQFNHSLAQRKIAKGAEALQIFLMRYPSPDLERFRQQLLDMVQFLDKLIESTQSLKVLHPFLVDDLLNNARRRMDDKSFDDAAARIYRALELYGQIVFTETVGYANNAVKPEDVPEAIREIFATKYMDVSKGVLKLPLSATFEFLKWMGHEAGRRFFDNIKEIEKIQTNRNNSILAHGISPVSEHAAGVIWETITKFVKFENSLDFPKLP
jgi:CRISPR-associated protein (TIGR02710 family)